MNFFEHQDQARRNTTQLVMLFFLAIALMIVAFYLIAIVTLQVWGDWDMAWWEPQLFGWISAFTLGIIAFGSLDKMFQLRRGGAAVAESLGGKQLNPQTNDATELQCLNVVAEMALASGTPIPTVYLLSNEQGINAFAAGYAPDDAVIGVTQGCIEQLSRDELQGVIAHEFSHILNGDMRLNLRLMSVLQGLLIIYIMGRIVLRSMGRSSSGSSRDKGGGLIVLILVAGLSMMVIGGIGLIVGRMIKSAISRQREFLADASAVQFTRNPDGITNALKRLGGYSVGSKIYAAKAEEASHMFFGEAANISFVSGWLFDTHPPLADRIRRLTGSKVVTSVSRRSRANASGANPTAAMSFHGGTETSGRQATPVKSAAPSPATPSPRAQSPAANAFVNQIGTSSAKQIATAHTFLETLPAAVGTAVRSPDGAMAIVYALLLDDKPAVRSKQLQILKTPTALTDALQVDELAQVLQSIDMRQHLSLLDLSIPALRTITHQQCAEFFKTIQALVRADGQLSISEYVLQLILQKRLRPHFQKRREAVKAVTNLDSAWHDCEVVLATLARIGHKKPDAAFYAFKSGLSCLPGANKRELPKRLPMVKLNDLGQSLRRLEAAVPKLKQAIVEAAAHTVLLDNEVTPREAELLRAVVITLDCPIPPFLEPVAKSAKAKSTHGQSR